MLYIEHRKNNIQDVAGIAIENGAEIDLRSGVNSPGSIHLSHDPWKKGDDFEAWAKAYAERKFQGLLILNTKEDGLEARATEILKSLGISKYIFLDTTFPTLVKNVEAGNGDRFFLRLSHYEDLDGLLKFAGKVSWLWVDCFALKLMDEAVLKKAKEKFKLCMVSPELQGGGETELNRFLSQSNYFDAICTKKPDTWKRIRGE